MVKEPKVKLTKEEKKERRKNKKLERKLKLEEKKRQVKRDYLARELEYCRLNREKHEKSWKETLLQIKIQELKTVYQLAVNHSERILDAKDYQISLLLDELEESEQQYEFNLKQHTENFDRIINNFNVTLDDLKDDYDKELKETLESTRIEKEMQNNIDTENEDFLKTMLFGLKKTGADYRTFMRSEYLAKIEDETHRSKAELLLMESKLENRFEKLWISYKETIHNYVTDNSSTKKQYDLHYNQDVYVTNLIKQQTQQLWRAHEKICNLKFEQTKEKDHTDLRLSAKINEQQFFVKGFQTLKYNLKNNVDADNRQIKFLVQNSNKAMQNLKNISNEGEFILKLSTICSKFVTEKELILPYPEYSEKTCITAKESLESREKKMMDQFWSRFGQGDALRSVLYEELLHNKNENAKLKQQLYNHCLTPEYSCAIMEQNEQICKKIIPDVKNTDKSRTVTVIEAAHIVGNLKL